MEQDKDLSNRCKGLLKKYEEAGLCEGDKDKLFQNEILPIANKAGFNFTLDDYKELQLPAKYNKLDDKELDNVVGGVVATVTDSPILIQCYLLSDREKLGNYFKGWPNDCPDWKYSQGPGVKSCGTCKYFTCGPL